MVEWTCTETWEPEIVATPLRRVPTGFATTVARALAVIVLVTASLGAGVTSASAHDDLIGSVPAADETMTTALDEVTLTFNEPPLAVAASEVQVTDPAGTSVVVGPITLSDRSLVIPVSPTVAGGYDVVWRTASSDSHPISGQFRFTYAGPLPSAIPSASASVAPSATPEASASSGAADPANAADSVSGFLPLVIGVLAIVVIAIGIAITRARRTGNSGS